MKLIPANILTAFQNTDVVGSKVLDHDKFIVELTKCLETYDTSNDRITGQHFVIMPKAAFVTVSAGDGKRTVNASDYVPRLWRGRVELFLKRECAGETHFLATVVYTIEAYLRDPDVVSEQAEVQRIKESGATHVIIAVIASSGPQAPHTPYRLVANLAGGNREALAWDADTIRLKARATKEYWDEWCVVAD